MKTTATSSLLLALVACVAVNAVVVVPGEMELPSANFFLASAAFTNVTGLLVSITVGPGCVPVVPANITTTSADFVAFYDFGVAQLTGCASFADIINTIEFAQLAQLGATLSIFSLPPQANWQEGYFDPIGVASTYTALGYKLVVTSMAVGEQLDALAANGTVVTVVSDVGDWVRFSATGQFIAFRVVFGIIFWVISAGSFFINIRTVLKDGSAYRVFKYNNAIYWVMFGASTLLAIDTTIDPYGFQGLIPLGNWFYIRYGGILMTIGLTALLTSAWSKVITSSPLQAIHYYRWVTNGIQFVIFASYVCMTVCAMVACQRYTYNVVFGEYALSLKNAFDATGGILFFMCVSGLFFGLSLLFYLRTFSSLQGAHRTTNTRITLLMIAASFDQLLFAILTQMINNYFMSVSTYFAYVIVEHTVMLLMFSVVIVSLNVSGFRFSSYQDSASSPRRESASNSARAKIGNAKSASSDGLTSQTKSAGAAVENPDEFVKSMNELALEAIENGHAANAAAPVTAADIV